MNPCVIFWVFLFAVDMEQQLPIHLSSPWQPTLHFQLLQIWQSYFTWWNCTVFVLCMTVSCSHWISFIYIHADTYGRTCLLSLNNTVFYVFIILHCMFLYAFIHSWTSFFHNLSSMCKPFNVWYIYTTYMPLSWICVYTHIYGTVIYYVAQTVCKSVILLSQPLEYWDYSYAPQHLAVIK